MLKISKWNVDILTAFVLSLDIYSSDSIVVYFWRYKIWNQNNKFKLLIRVEGM